ncbi:hypothetical protein [Thiomicrorhabdus arctica]|uniref:hypothetical protein n=1 Tax=Thiomicrorhabdus arctica TaxID=131540 RepID=UPI000364CE6C|nr:hypothetical protein [Thiomicrorhabdus arctica]
MNTLFKYGKATIVLFFSVFVILFKFFFDEPMTTSNNDSSEDMTEEDAPNFDLGKGQSGDYRYDENGYKHFP